MTFPTAYVPSANKAIRDGCPDRLAVVAQLFGVAVAPPERCRVLEIGCAEGAHLVPLALLAPASRYVGVDLEPRAVEQGNETIAKLGLDNVRLQASDFRELGGKSERFDYVVAHGMYSWVDRDTRDALLSVLREVLDDGGVGFLSFNALPGGHARNMLRELLLPHVRSIADAHERIARAREVTRALLREPSRPGSAFAMLRAELEHFSRASDSLVHHDYLAETNESVAFGTFVEHLDRHGLEYLADAQTLDRTAFGGHPLAEALDAPSLSGAERLAYVDLLEMRRFRQAVVCRKGAGAVLDFGRAGPVWLASSAEPVAPGAVHGSGPVRFKTVSGLELETTVPAIKLALYELGRVWPHALTLADLAERVAERLGEGSNAAELSRLLFDSAASAAIRAFARAPRSVRAPSQKPLATTLARLEVARGDEVTSLHHEPVKVDVAFHRTLLSLLDGTRDRDALARALADELESGRLSVPGIEPGKRAHWEGLLGREVDAGLEKLARYALLIA